MTPRFPASWKLLLWLWVPVVGYTALIFWLSSDVRPIPPVLQWPGADKLIHTLEYLLLGLLLLRAISRSNLMRFGDFTQVWRRMEWGALFVVVVIGGLDELYQWSIPGRINSVWDLLFDGIGGALGVRLYSLLCLLFPPREKKVKSV